MKKSIFLMLMLLVAVSNSEAQFRIALTGGVQRATVPGNGAPLWDTLNYTDFKGRDGIHAGILAEWRLTRRPILYFQTGMSYSMKGREFTGTYSTGNVRAAAGTQWLNYLEVPANLTVKFKIAGPLRFTLGGGPYLGFLYSGKEKRSYTLQNSQVLEFSNTDLKVPTASVGYQNVDLGWNGRAGFEIGPVILNAFYTQGIQDFYVNAPGGKYRHQTYGASLGIFLNKEQSKDKKPKKPKAPKDKDKDSVPDDIDACPDLPGTLATKGCPDADGDSIADNKDKCPDVKGLARYNGCPVPDTDKDGINDEEDKCPDIAGLKKYNGCPLPDRDKDGIPDEEDKCPDSAGVAKHKGCPIPDTDKDGVNDDEDKCPKVKGVAENQGCPPVKKKVVEKVNTAAKRIQFEYKSVILTADSKRVLNEVANLMVDDPTLNLIIEGHTSSDGDSRNHQPLSEARANSVRIYLMSKGISPYRLKAIGYGDTQPLVQGTSAAALSKNRRVEMKVVNYEVGF